MSIIGVSLLQFYWLQKAFDVKDKQFNQSAHIALLEVADLMAVYNKAMPTTTNPVNQLTSDYFVVNVNDEDMEPSVLKNYLLSSFKKHNIKSDFEFGIYDCSNDKMMYADEVHLSNPDKISKPTRELPKFKGFNYYFGVRFTNKKVILAGEMGIWLYSSLILLVVIVFFGYAIYVILDQQRLSEIRKAFVNNLTHEFKTPISTIEIASDVLLSSELIQQEDRFKNYVTIIKQENNRIRNNVERVLQLALDEKNPFRLEKTVFILNDWLEALVTHWKNSEEIDISFTSLSNRILVEADALHFENLLYNLLDNAKKYCIKTPVITIELVSKKQSTLLIFKDNGIGIDSKFLKQIFTPFYRVPTGDIHNVKGFGLGLSYVNQVIKQHQWKITVASTLQNGTTFTIEIPLLKK